MTDPHLRFAQTIKVGNVKRVSSGSCVHASCASFLQPQVVEDFWETCILQSVFLIYLLHGASTVKITKSRNVKVTLIGFQIGFSDFFPFILEENISHLVQFIHNYFVKKSLKLYLCVCSS